MARAKVSSDYRITIPHEVRKVIPVQKGQVVSVIPVGGIIEIVPDRDIAEMEGAFPALSPEGFREEGDRL